MLKAGRSMSKIEFERYVSCLKRNSGDFCPGVQNPADLPSRGMNEDELATNAAWWTGPKFLCQSEQSWPAHPASKTVPEKGNEKNCKESSNHSTFVCN